MPTPMCDEIGRESENDGIAAAMAAGELLFLISKPLKILTMHAKAADGLAVHPHWALSARRLPRVCCSENNVRSRQCAAHVVRRRAAVARACAPARVHPASPAGRRDDHGPTQATKENRRR